MAQRAMSGLWRSASPCTLVISMIGDTTLFHRSDMVEAAWRIAPPVLDVWQTLPPRDFPNYAAGSRGPASADALVQRDGRKWW